VRSFFSWITTLWRQLTLPISHLASGVWLAVFVQFRLQLPLSILCNCTIRHILVKIIARNLQVSCDKKGLILSVKIVSYNNWKCHDKNRIGPICEKCVVQQLKVSYDKNRIGPMCENCAIRHTLSDCIKRP
jgi:hypothetical protein